MTTKKFCRRCGSWYEDFPALSRFDNKTPICSPCGVDEAMMDFTGVALLSPLIYSEPSDQE